MATAEHIAVWLYGAPSYRMRLIDNYSMLAANFKILQENGCFFVNFAGSFAAEGTPFYDLEVYLISHLMWDYEQDVNKLIDKFFHAYYKEAAKPMQAYFENILAHHRELDAQYTSEGKLFKVIIPWWGKESILLSDLQRIYTKEYLATLEQPLFAAQAIVQAMADGEKKTVLEGRVRAETLAVRFWRIALYNDSMDNIDKAVESWYNDAKSVGLFYPSGDYSLEKYYTEWKAGNYLFFIQK